MSPVSLIKHTNVQTFFVSSEEGPLGVAVLLPDGQLWFNSDLIGHVKSQGKATKTSYGVDNGGHVRIDWQKRKADCVKVLIDAWRSTSPRGTEQPQEGG